MTSPIQQNLSKAGWRPFIWPVFTIGFAATMTQIVFLRELMVVFSGNELSLAILLASWLLWTSVGSGLPDKIFAPIRRPGQWLGLVQIALSVILPISLIFIRASLALFHHIPGEIPGLAPILWISFVATGPFCLLSGFAFALSGNFLHISFEVQSDSVGRVYLVEAAGSALGGFLVSLFLLRMLNSAEILSLAASIEFLSGLSLLALLTSHRILKRFSILLAILFLVGTFIATPVLQTKSLLLRWKGQVLIANQNTIYENIVLTRLGEQTNFYQNGLLTFSVPDLLGSEETTQFALLEHPNPKTVLLIGGGLGGQLEKILAHPSVQHVDYVEQDPALIRLGKQHLRGLRSILENPKIHVHFGDARLYLRKAHTHYSVIILNAPPPCTAQINRLYTREFFQIVSRHLSDTGLFSFSLPSSENFIDRDLSHLLVTFRQTLLQVFPNVLLLPGPKAHFFASFQSGLLTSDYHVLVSRLQKRGVSNLFVSPYYLPFRLSPERVQSFSRQLHGVHFHKMINTDFHPLAYYYDILLWSTYFYTGTRNFLRFLAHIPVTIFYLFFTGIYLLFALVLVLKKNRLSGQVGLSIFTIGFTEIALEVILILGFQLIYGYAYYWLSLIVTFFMAGLALGAWRALQLRRDFWQTFSLFRWIQFIAFLFPLILIAFFSCVHGKSIPLIFIDSAFAALALASGFLGGFQFPMGNRLFWKGKSPSHAPWGTLYSVDLLGSVFGALLIATWALPLLGIIPTLLLLSLGNFLAWGVLFLQNRS